MLGAAGCPVCAAVNEDRDRYFFWFLIESYAESSAIQVLQRAHGFCRWHSQHLVDIGPRYVLAVVMDYLTESVAKDLEATAQGATPTLNRCPACRAEDASASRAITHLLETFDDQGVADRYRQGSGLCRGHLLWALREASAEHRERLLEPVRRRLDAFRADFAEYFRKVDYRYSHEPKGAEQRAWFRAMCFLAGDALTLSMPKARAQSSSRPDPGQPV